ncbi:hypothetical protein [Streptomyces fagopyri]|uniref:hypothetical protein n=1 Tax=Streptomyces fagopyri TaxID=2662397 RepID=UPI0038033BEA
MPHYALDITLTRTLPPAQLHHVAPTMPLAANHDATRLLPLVRAETLAKALNRLRHRMGGRLPIEVITTHYPDPRGQLLYNIVFPPTAHAALDTAAEHTGQPLHLFEGTATAPRTIWWPCSPPMRR